MPYDTPPPPSFVDPTFPVPSRGILDPIYVVPAGQPGYTFFKYQRPNGPEGGRGSSSSGGASGSSSAPDVPDLTKEWVFDKTKDSNAYPETLSGSYAGEGAYKRGWEAEDRTSHFLISGAPPP